MTEPTKNDYLVLEAALKTEKSKVKELQDALKLSRKKLIEAEKKIMYHDKITKFDKMAREGQMNRMRFLEHELKEVKHENIVQNQLRNEAEIKAKSTNSTLQLERAVQLKNIHELSLAKKKLDHTKARKKKVEILHNKDKHHIFELKTKIQTLEHDYTQECETTRNYEKQNLENLDQIDDLVLENKILKSKLLEKQDETDHHIKRRIQLDKECRELRTKLSFLTNSKILKDSINGKEFYEDEVRKEIQLRVLTIPKQTPSYRIESRAPNNKF